MSRLSMSPSQIPPVPWRELREMRLEFRPRIILGRIAAVLATVLAVHLTFTILEQTLSPRIFVLVRVVEFAVILKILLRVFETTGEPRRIREDLQLHPVRAILREAGSQYVIIARLAIFACLIVGVNSAINLIVPNLGQLNAHGGWGKAAYVILHDGISVGLGLLAGKYCNIPAESRG